MQDLPFVWSLRKDRVQSYALGTMHQTWTDYSAAEHELLSRCSMLLLEADPRKVCATELVKAISAMPQPLLGLDDLTERELQLLNEHTGTSREVLEKTPPLLIPFMYLRQVVNSIGSPSYSMEQELVEAAEASKKQVVGLEILEEQIDFLKTGISKQLQEFPLKKLADPCFREKYVRNMRGLIDAYTSGEVSAIFAVIERYKKECGVILGFEKVPERNKNMVDRSIPHLAESCLVAVGAMHLLGDQSMLDLYREKGFSVERV